MQLLVGAVGVAAYQYSNFITIKNEYLNKTKNTDTATTSTAVNSEQLSGTDVTTAVIEVSNQKDKELIEDLRPSLDSIRANRKAMDLDKLDKDQPHANEIHTLESHHKLFIEKLISKSKLATNIHQKEEASKETSGEELTALRKEISEMTDVWFKRDDELKSELLSLYTDSRKLNDNISLNDNNDSNNNDKDNGSDTDFKVPSFLDTETIKDTMNNWYSNLSTIQQICFTLIISKGLIFSALVNIILVYFGDYLINRFSLETRYPKLHFLIQLRKKFNRYYLISNTLIIIYVILIEVAFCVAIISL